MKYCTIFNETEKYFLYQSVLSFTGIHFCSDMIMPSFHLVIYKWHVIFKYWLTLLYCLYTEVGVTVLEIKPVL